MPRIRVLSAAIAAVLAMHVATARAQTDQPEQPVQQMQLAEKQVLAFIAAQKSMSDILEKLPEDQQDNPPPAVAAQLDANAKKHGFKNLQEYDDVAANVYLVMSSIDPQTKTFTDPAVAIRKEIAQVSANKTLSAAEKKEMLQDLNEALKSVQPIQFPGNIELVRKHYDKIDASLN
jgi:hypothetical protein